MSISTLTGARGRTYIDGNFNSLKPTSITMSALDELIVTSAGTIKCQSSEGNAGDILTLDGSTQLEWQPHVIGDSSQSAEYYPSSTFTTTSGTPVIVTSATFTASGLESGRYVIMYSCEFKGATTAVVVTVKNDTTADTYGNFLSTTALADFDGFSGFKTIALASGAHDFSMYINSVTPGNTSTIQKIRFQIYQVA